MSDLDLFWKFVVFAIVRPLLMGTKLLTETHEVKFRWADLTKLLPKFRVREGLRNLDCAN